MGYRSDWKITCEPIEGLGDLERELDGIDYVNGSFGYRSGEEIHNHDSMKWYDHETDLCKVSAALPHLTITSIREGGESGDIARAVYRNGRSTGEVQASIAFPEPEWDKIPALDEEEKGRVLDELEKKRKARIRESAASKLTPEERRELGLT